MRTYFIRLSLALAICTFVGLQPLVAQVYNLTFQVDMSAANVDDPSTVGIRGSLPPLSWTENYPMQGPDANGIYTVTVPFENVEYGTQLQYKYFFGDNHWDNDRYGEAGNRLAILACQEQVIPVDTWDEHEAFPTEMLQQSLFAERFIDFVYIIGSGKKRGLSIEEIARENIDFWSFPAPKEANPGMFLFRDEVLQAASPFGYFELVSNSPDKVEYIICKDWEMAALMWDRKGTVKGVTSKEMTEFVKYNYEFYTKQQGLSVSFKELDDHRMLISITK